MSYSNEMSATATYIQGLKDALTKLAGLAEEKVQLLTSPQQGAAREMTALMDTEEKACSNLESSRLQLAAHLKSLGQTLGFVWYDTNTTITRKVENTSSPTGFIEIKLGSVKQGFQRGTTVKLRSDLAISACEDLTSTIVAADGTGFQGGKALSNLLKLLARARQ